MYCLFTRHTKQVYIAIVQPNVRMTMYASRLCKIALTYVFCGQKLDPPPLEKNSATAPACYKRFLTFTWSDSRRVKHFVQYVLIAGCVTGSNTSIKSEICPATNTNENVQSRFYG